MKKNWTVFILLLGLLGSCESPTAPTEKPVTPVINKVQLPRTEPPSEGSVEAPFLWKVVHEKGGSYVLGTIHQAVKLDDIVNKALYDKIDKSRIVVFESDISALEENRSEAMALSQFPPGKSLRTILGEQYWDTLKLLLENIPEAMLDRFKPWLVSTLVTFEEIRRLNLYLDRGMDDELRRYVELKSRPMGFLENWKDGIDDADRAMTTQYLREMLDKKESIGDDFLALRSSYLSGEDAKILEQIKIETKSDKQFMEVLIYGRTQKWLDPLVGFLNEGNAFIVVGTGHLVGERGLIALLKKRGFKVVRVKSVRN